MEKNSAWETKRSSKLWLFNEVSQLEGRCHAVAIGATPENLAVMGKALRSGWLFSVRTWEDVGDWTRLIGMLGHEMVFDKKVIIIKKEPMEAVRKWTHHLDLIYINPDNDDYAQVRAIVKAWVPFVKKGGVVVIGNYDIYHKRVLQVVEWALLNVIKQPKLVGNMLFARRA